MSKEIIIYTWGNQIRKNPPNNSQHNFCVTGISSYKPKGVNLKKVDGRDSRLQEKLQRQPKFEMYMESALKKIQENDLTIISINCHKGRHRSVGFSILLSERLQELGYTVTLHHMEI